MSPFLRLKRLTWVVTALAPVVACALRAAAEDVSAPVILQDFENRYGTIESRMADVFRAGYGAIYTPPPGRADSGNGSVGYDQYDRFDLGSAGSPTLYGTEAGLKALVNETHKMGGNYFVDFVMNHNGFKDLGSRDGQGHSFYDAGGYPGFALSLPNDVDGDFHSAFASGDLQGRISGLIDIAQEKNNVFIRNPVDASDPRNLRPGTQAAFGRIANLADANNRRFYPDTSLQPISVFDPKTGEQDIKIYPFNPNNPMAGAPVPENAMGYLTRNAQWLVQTVGVDGFRLDAAKHYPDFVLNYFDRAVYRSSFRTLLNGQQEQIFSFSEAYTGDQDFLQNSIVRKDINPADPGRVGGNRDALDFPLFFALTANLGSNGIANNWFNVRGASLDLHDDGLHNGSQGVTFAASHDDFGPYLGNVAYAYTLMLPGNTVVYYNGKEFGDNRDFPKPGRGDALGGTFGNAIPALVDLRNRYGRGDYVERWIEQHDLAFERKGSCLVLLNNEPFLGGFDSRTLQTSFAPGTLLLEQTGNAGDPNSDPFGDIPKVLRVKADGTVDARFLHNVKPGFNSPGNGGFTGNGYLVYGLPTPQGSLSLTNVAQTLAGQTPDRNAPNVNYLNGTTRLSDVSVIKGDAFQVKLNTTKVNLLGDPTLRDHDADGDNALLKLDGGLDVNHSGAVDFTSPNTVTYGFEQFKTTHSPGYFNADGNSAYAQTIDATQLSEGYHYLTARAFRHRADGGPAVFTDWRQTIYVDRLKPVSAVASFDARVAGVNENRELRVRSVDQTANSVHTFLDLPASLTDSQVLSLLSDGNHAGQIDRDLFSLAFGNVTSGNHVATIVSFEITGNFSVQRVPGLFTSTILGAGLGDTDFSGTYTPHDVDLFGDVLRSDNSQFNPAADLNADGLVDNTDLNLLGQRLRDVNADDPTLAEYQALVNSVPEPAAGALFLMAITGLLRRYRRA